MDKKYILFDLDGTITDPKEGITKAVQYALEKFHIEVKDKNELLRFIGPPLKESFIRYYDFRESDAQDALKEYRKYYSEKGIFDCTVYDGLENVLKELKKQGKALIVATSKPTVFAERIIEHFGLDKYFNFICGSNLDGTRENKAEVIKFALDECGIKDTSQTVMVGDREHDVFGARKNRIECVGVLYGYGTYDELKNAGADYIIDDINGLYAFFKNQK
ncbi:MAG: HAD family hydrolase [Clostridia bacterium]|nr:HAD family hydrolase [Clostridia bacterium]